jgi:hypothetical protein
MHPTHISPHICSHHYSLQASQSNHVHLMNPQNASMVSPAMFSETTQGTARRVCQGWNPCPACTALNGSVRRAKHYLCAYKGAEASGNWERESRGRLCRTPQSPSYTQLDSYSRWRFTLTLHRNFPQRIGVASRLACGITAVQHAGDLPGARA